MLDVVIIGGGPAGLSAALVLGRCRRRVLVCDTGRPRNAAAQALHGYLTRDGLAPCDLLRIGREELRPYGVELRTVAVTGATPAEEGFDVHLETGERLATRRLLLATGVRDHLPEIEGLDRCFGTTVHHCPYCDGWEIRDRKVAVIGRGASGTGLALSLRTWTDRVVLCCHRRSNLEARHRLQLAEHGIAVVERRIIRLEHDDGHVRCLRMDDGSEIACTAVFFSTGQSQQSELPRRLGCELTRHGTVKTDHLGQTCVPGLYVAGDASRDMQFAIVAAAEGAKAAVAINKALQAKSGLAAAGALR